MTEQPGGNTREESTPRRYCAVCPALAAEAGRCATVSLVERDGAGLHSAVFCSRACLRTWLLGESAPVRLAAGAQQEASA